MKVLWLSNCILTDSTSKATGTWLFAISRELCKRENIQMANITISGSINKVTRDDCNNIKQWILPYKLGRFNKPSLPNKALILQVQEVINEYNPDIIHIWGIELFWGLLVSEGYIDKNKTIIEIQGINSVWADYVYADLTFKDLLSCVRLKELICPSFTIFSTKKRLKSYYNQDKRILSSCKYISTQSDWTRGQIFPFISKDSMVLETLRPLREAFLKSKQWSASNLDNKFTIFAFSSGASPLKGMHIVIKALSILSRKYPNIKLRIAGGYQHGFPCYKKAGYVKYIEKLICTLNLRGKVEFLGSLDENQLVNEMQNASIMVQPSFVESYCAALAEGMAVGIPCVVAYAGAMPELAVDGESALYYSPSDYVDCANKIMRLYENKGFAQSISNSARSIALNRNDIVRVVDRQISLYENVLKAKV